MISSDLSLHEEPKRKHHQSAKRNHPEGISIPEHLERVEIVLDNPEEEVWKWDSRDLPCHSGGGRNPDGSYDLLLSRRS
jgi:hypothetical protein